jgi:hypothetical protein
MLLNSHSSRPLSGGQNASDRELSALWAMARPTSYPDRREPLLLYSALGASDEILCPASTCISGGSTVRCCQLTTFPSGMPLSPFPASIG